MNKSFIEKESEAKKYNKKHVFHFVDKHKLILFIETLFERIR